MTDAPSGGPHEHGASPDPHEHGARDPLDPRIFGDGTICFGCGPAHPIGFHLDFRRDGDEIVTTFVPDERYQGPRGVMHGGLVTTLADEIAAWAIIGLLGKFGFTVSIHARLLKPVRIGVPVEARSKIVRPGTRIVGTSVRIAQDGVDAYTGEFSFVLLDRGGAERLLAGPIPESWERFCR